MIQRMLHTIWFADITGDKELPPHAISTLEVWRRLEGEQSVKLWSEDAVTKLVQNTEMQEVLHTIAQCRYPAMKADIARLAVLYLEGGCWSDMKTIPRQPILTLLEDENCVLIADHFPVNNRKQSDEHYCNSFIASPARDPFLGALLKEVVLNIKNRSEGSVFDITGGGVFRAVMRKLRRDGHSVHIGILNREVLWKEYLRRISVQHGPNNAFHWSQMRGTVPLYI